jgi:hypothetical protein
MNDSVKKGSVGNSDDDVVKKAPVSRQDDVESIYDLFKTDENVETKGVFLNYGKSIKILVKRAGGANRNFDRVIKELTKPHRQLVKSVQSGTASDADAKQLDGIMKRAYAMTVVEGWSGVRGPDKREIEFSVEACIKLFDDLPPLWVDIRDYASNYLNFMPEDIEVVAKN